MKTKMLGMMLLAFVVMGCTSTKTITQEEAQKKALAIQEGEVVATESDLEDDDPSYTFTIKTDTALYEIEIDAKNGEMISQDMEALPQTDTTQYAVSEEQAKQIAMDKVPGATIVKVELDDNDGSTTYQYEIKLRKDRTEYNVDVDAQTGAITSYEEDLD